MSSLLNPALFNPDENDNLIHKKKISHNRTQKRHEPSVTERVSKVLSTIHDKEEEEDEPGSHLGDFSPPPPPSSSGVQRTITKEPMQNLGPFNIVTSNQSEYTLNSENNPSPLDNDNNYELKNFKTNYGDNKSNEEYYKKYVPNYPNHSAGNTSQGMNKQYYQSMQDTINTGSPNDVLLTKLNYMIHLLEEKQDERTNNVTEEVVLYSFLGIFIIFIVDSFSRVGKYVR